MHTYTHTHKYTGMHTHLSFNQAETYRQKRHAYRQAHSRIIFNTCINAHIQAEIHTQAGRATTSTDTRGTRTYINIDTQGHHDRLACIHTSKPAAGARHTDM